MPVLTPDETTLLADLAKPAVHTIGRPRIKQLLALCWRCINAEREADQNAAAWQFVAKALWLAASGVLTEEMIAQQPRLTEEQKADCLKLLQLRYDADAWRKHTGFDLPPLPEAVFAEPETEPVTL
ncbi:MAG: hypothetical protein ACRYFX_18820 [Janthinobacterium lividum]